MNLDGLTISPAASPGDVFAAIDFIDGDDGPIVGRLVYDDSLSADLGEPETLPALVANQGQAMGWLFHVVDERAPAAGAAAKPLVYLLGPNLSMPDALSFSLALLDEWEPEQPHSYESSLHAVAAMGRADVEYSLMPQPLAAEAKSQRRRHQVSRVGAGRR